MKEHSCGDVMHWLDGVRARKFLDLAGTLPRDWRLAPDGVRIHTAMDPFHGRISGLAEATLGCSLAG